MAPKKQSEANELMIVNDSPGEECRIAILQEGHLEELFTERTATATDVGNIYKGRVVNVEPAIQAAFIDYGQGQNGFLHISDLHPKYFPGPAGSERTERVGKKIPRRERPPIQAALHRGDEILVQVLKEGIGTKGPTLTSYLSIPGRLLVMMPNMDRVGVSRKVEDEEKRREMRQILDSLNLPDGFGFILRTAGYGKTKTELKRDAAYLTRLWKVMEKRIKGVGAPCELYTESDLFIRTIRDVLRPSIKAIIVDSESAFDRASMFLRVVSPRSAPKVIRYRRSAPIFHAFDIERQIELIHSREVPLASGGRLVIDQTEALVAIDVNSGRSRSARDSETNAYETNIEAADEICRQLRLRDLGGLIVNDLIDMRAAKHRKAIEERFATNLKRDRAKATALAISDFGILEMTRQRMRPSLRKSHFMPCPHCNGHGEIRVPEYVAADAARHVGFLLQFDRVSRVEVVCSPRVASVMLSGKRRELVRLEDSSGKRVDVRVSDAIAVDRVDYYAYDERNADIDITKLPALVPPTLEQLEAEQSQPERDRQIVVDGADAARRRHGPADAAAIALAGGFDDDFEDEFELDESEVDTEISAAPSQQSPPSDGSAIPAQEGRRGRRRRRRHRGEGAPQSIPVSAAPSQTPATGAPVEQGSTPEHPGKRRRRRGRRRGRGDRPQDAAGATAIPNEPETNPEQQSDHSVRIHELAKELSVTAREVIERCEPEPSIHPVSNSLSSVSPDEAATIRGLFANGATEPTHGEALTDQPASEAGYVQPSGHELSQPSGRSKRRRRRRGRGRGHQPINGIAQTPSDSSAIMQNPVAPTPVSSDTQQIHQQGPQGGGHGHEQGSGKRRRRRRGRKGGGQTVMPQSIIAPSLASNQPPSPGLPIAPVTGSSTASAEPSANLPGKKPRRALYRAGRTRVSPAAREVAADDE